MKKPNVPRKMVNISGQAYGKARELKAEIEAKLMLDVTLGSVIDRAITCLHDAQKGGAWLSPKEAAPQFEQRFKDHMIQLVGQLLGRVAPDRKLKKIDFQGGQMRVFIDDDKPIMLAKFAGGEKAAGAILN